MDYLTGPDELAQRLPDEVEAIIVLTRNPDETYLEKYIPRVGASMVARSVKIADINDNLDARRYLEGPEFESLRDRYRKARAILLGQEVVS